MNASTPKASECRGRGTDILADVAVAADVYHRGLATTTLLRSRKKQRRRDMLTIINDPASSPETVAHARDYYQCI